MIKKSVFENEIIENMIQNLKNKKIAQVSIPQALESLNSAMDLLDQCGLMKQSDQILKIVAQVAQKEQETDLEIEDEQDPTFEDE